MDRRTFLATVAAGTSAGLAGCGATSGASEDYDVGMAARKFDPAGLTVAPGTTVVWRNTSSVTHTVTAYADRIPEEAAFFASGDYETQQAAQSAWAQKVGGAIHQAETFEHEFTVPGEYPYFCIPHEAAGMTGVVTVTADAGES